MSLKSLIGLTREKLAAELIAGRVPDWLEAIDIKAQPNAIYRIKR